MKLKDKVVLITGGGSGLGLAIAGRLMQLMGGWIGYDDNPGGGSVFWLELPVLRTAAATRACGSEDATCGARATS